MLNTEEAAKLKKILNGKDEGLAQVFNALSDPKRCQIFRSFLKQREELCVSDIAKVMNISMPSASQHLKILEQNGLLKKTRMGREIYFAPRHDNPLVVAIIKAIQ